MTTKQKADEIGGAAVLLAVVDGALIAAGLWWTVLIAVLLGLCWALWLVLTP